VTWRCKGNDIRGNGTPPQEKLLNPDLKSV
jgi:hypothetical protein